MVENRAKKRVEYGPKLKYIMRNAGSGLLHFLLRDESTGVSEKESFKLHGWQNIGNNHVQVSLAGTGSNQGRNFKAIYDHVNGGGFLELDA